MQWIIKFDTCEDFFKKLYRKFETLLMTEELLLYYSMLRSRLFMNFQNTLSLDKVLD